MLAPPNIYANDKNELSVDGTLVNLSDDWSNYLKMTGATGWPTNYEETTPLYGGVLVDIKFFANLDRKSWNNPVKYLANTGHGEKEVTYKLELGEYGVFTDLYHVERGAKNRCRKYNR